MAMLASKAGYPAPLGSSNSQASSNLYASNTSAPRTQQTHGSISTSAGTYSSPTESEFSEKYDSTDSARYVLVTAPIGISETLTDYRSWDEKQVGEWLRSIRCGQYEALFRANNFNGDNLLECDQKVLQELGIKKVGDRVRIFVAIKQLRNKSASARKRRNRDSFAALDGQIPTPSSTDSPRGISSRALGGSSNRRWSRQVDPLAFHAYNANGQKSSSRPNSPLTESDNRALRAHRYVASPVDGPRKDSAGQGYFSHPSSASTSSGRRPETPSTANQAVRNLAHVRGNPSIDGLTMGSLPPNSPVIRIIYTGGQTKVINVKNCRSPDEVILTVLKKLNLPETHYKNYCFYVLDGLDPQPANCRRVTDLELMRISEGKRQERNRLILRKINDGEPDIEEVRRAAQFAMDESANLHSNALSSNSMRNQLKLQKLTGEPWHNIAQPMSPASVMDRNRNIMSTAEELERPETQQLKPGQNSGSKLRSFFGARPPSEMIIHDMSSYFPSHQREDIERTMRLSVRRSQRMSRAASRMSVMSNSSWASSLKDAPPIPSIADAWLAQTGQPTRASRPLSVSKFALPSTAFRDSIISTSLQPLQEESPIEPDRKSYISFNSGSDSANQTLSDHDANKSYFDETLSVGDNSNSLQERLSMLVAEDGEEEDQGLNSFLSGNQFDGLNWIKGSLIGEGSFGSVYLALHAVTGELMAVKQVELPNVQHGTENDKKKNLMITALKHEIDLLQGLQHPKIVQYLGTSQDDAYLNIFLEYVPGGSIAVMLKQYNTFPEPLVRNFVRQILEGLAYLHNKNIIHRDIKGANVLVDNKGGIKISDFGISKRVEASSMLGGQVGGGLNRPSLQGSVFWMAPEVVRQSAHTKKADIWSLGCLIVEMFSGQHPFPDKTQLQAIFAIGSTKAKPKIPENCSDDAKEFLEKTFEIDHEKRPSAEELLQEKFLVPMA